MTSSQSTDRAAAIDRDRTLRKWGMVAFGAQFLIVLAWQLTEWNRFSLTWDYSLYNQATYLVSHGTWNPYVTFRHFYFYQNDMELFIWGLGILQRFLPISWLLLLAQAAAIGMADWIAYLWVLDLAKPSKDDQRRRVILFITLGILFFNPWVYWAISFDVHTEVLIMPLIVGLARELWAGRIRRVIILTAATLLGGTVALTYLLAVGISGVFLKGSSRLIGIGIIVVSLLALVAIQHVPGGLKGVSIAGLYGYLDASSRTHLTGVISLAEALVAHPARGFDVLLASWKNTLGSVSAEGIVGVINPDTSIVGLLVLLEDGLIPGGVWSSPQIFQSIPVVIFTTIGTAAILLRWVSRLKSRLPWAIAVGLLSVNTAGWAAFWIPPLPGHWIRISSVAADQLRAVLDETPATSEVVSSQGFAGRFSGRRWFYIWWSLNISHSASGPPRYVLPIHTTNVTFLVSPYQGVELSTVAEELARIKYLSALRGVRLESSRGGIWAFKWRAPSVDTTLNVPLSERTYPAWALGTQEGVRLLTGDSDTWHMASSRKSGYLIDQFYKRLGPGSYSAIAKLYDNKPVILEVWNATADKLLLRRYVPPSIYTRVVKYAFQNVGYVKPTVYSGWGPFQLNPAPPPLLDNIELRIWTPKSNNAGVYWVNISHSTESKSIN